MKKWCIGITSELRENKTQFVQCCNSNNNKNNSVNPSVNLRTDRINSWIKVNCGSVWRIGLEKGWSDLTQNHFLSETKQKGLQQKHAKCLMIIAYMKLCTALSWKYTGLINFLNFNKMYSIDILNYHTVWTCFQEEEQKPVFEICKV